MQSWTVRRLAVSSIGWLGSSTLIPLGLRETEWGTGYFRPGHSLPPGRLGR